MSGQEEEAPELLRSWTDGSTSEVSHEFINNSDVTLQVCTECFNPVYSVHFAAWYVPCSLTVCVVVATQLIWTDFEGVEKVYANIEAGNALTQGKCRRGGQQKPYTEDSLVTSSNRSTTCLPCSSVQ